MIGFSWIDFSYYRSVVPRISGKWSRARLTTKGRISRCGISQELEEAED